MLLTWGLARALRPHTRVLICRHINCMLGILAMQANRGMRAQRDRCTRFAAAHKSRARTSLPLEKALAARGPGPRQSHASSGGWPHPWCRLQLLQGCTLATESKCPSCSEQGSKHLQLPASASMPVMHALPMVQQAAQSSWHRYSLRTFCSRSSYALSSAHAGSAFFTMHTAR